MAQATGCPEFGEVLQSLAGLLPLERNNSVAEHLETCLRCQETVAHESIHDTLIDALRQKDARLNLTAAEKQRIQQIIARLDMDKSVELQPAEKESLLGENDDTFMEIHPLSETEQICQLLTPSPIAGELGSLGKYRLLRVLGMGGMGIVFEARDPDLNRHVALKVMKPEWARYELARKRYLREAQLAASIEHDHIITIYEVSAAHAVPYLAMQLLRGQSLHERLEASRRTGKLDLPVEECLRIGREIALALGAAHARNLIHRDIKPGNIWLEEGTGRVKILDFGLAKPVTDDVHLTNAGTLIGTPAYMAPEQANGQAADPRADLFSLGVVLYRMTTGRLPFPGTTTLEILQSLSLVIPPAPRSVNTAVPMELSDLIEQLLTKDRNLRPGDGREIATRLARIEADEARRRDAAHSTFGNNSLRFTVSAAAAAFVALMLSVIVLTFKTKDGKETQVTVAGNGELQSVAIHADAPAGPVSPPGKVDKPALPFTRQPAPKQPQARQPGATLPAMSLYAMVRTPAKLEGVESWTLETVGHRVPVDSLAYSPNSKWLASLDGSGQIRVWEAESGKLVNLLMDDEPLQFGQLAWSPDSERIVRGNGTSESKVGLVVWHVATGRREHVFEDTGYVKRCGFMPDGEHVYSIQYTAGKEAGGIKIWSLKTEEQVDQFDTDTWLGDVSADGKFVAIVSATTSKIQAFEIGTWEQKWEIAIPNSSLQNFQSRHPVWSPDGKLLAAGPGYQSENVLILDATTGKLRIDVAAAAIHCPIAWSGDSRELTVGLAWGGAANGGLQVIDVTTGKLKRTGQGAAPGRGDSGTTALAVSPDGKWQANADCYSGSVYFYEASNGKPRHIAAGQATTETLGLQWLNDGQSLVEGHGFTGSQWTSACWQTVPGKLHERRFDFSTTATSPDGRSFVHGFNSEFCIRDAQSGELLQTLPHTDIGHGRASWSADGKSLVTSVLNNAGLSKRIKIWNPETGDLRAEFDNPLFPGGALALSANGSLLAVAQFSEGNVGLLDASNGKIVESIPARGRPLSLVFSPNDSALAVGLEDGKVRIISLTDRDAENKRPERVSFTAHASPITALAWSRDGRKLATTAKGPGIGGSSNGGIRLWSAGMGEPHGVWLAMNGKNAVAVSPTGHYRGTPTDSLIRRDLVVYVVQTAAGQLMLPPAEFEKRFGWKNDPRKIAE